MPVSDRHPIVNLLENHLPSFCWLTGYEVLLLLEAVDEDVKYDTIKVALSTMSRGACPRIERIQVPTPPTYDRRGPKWQYMYRFNPRFERQKAKRSAPGSHARFIMMIDALQDKQAPLSNSVKPNSFANGSYKLSGVSHSCFALSNFPANFAISDS